MKKIGLIVACVLITAQVFAQTGKASLSSGPNTNVSITGSDTDYAMIASFNGEKTTEVKEVITASLGDPTEHKDDLFVWFSKGVYTITLRSEKLIIDLDKKNASTSLVKKFEKLGEQISNKVSGSKL